MKIVLGILTLWCTWTIQSQAQIHISCDARETCDWDVETDETTNCTEIEESSLFVLNEDETMFIHTTETMKSAYYIKDKEQREGTTTWVFDVVSDVGNKYLFLVDLKEEKMQIASKSSEEFYLISFNIKHMWIDE